MKYKYKHKLTFMVLLAISIGCVTRTLAQDKKQITGTVSDDSGPLLGVSVVIKHTNQGTTSDENGSFTIMAKSSDTLVFSYLGLLTKEIPVNLQTRIDVALLPDETSLDEVVINAGYYKVSNKEKTGSITKLTAAEIKNHPNANPISAMQGRVPGLEITPTTGLAGGGYEVRIRGRNSISAGNEPLYIIDGIPYDSQTMGYATIGSTIIPGGRISPLSLLNPKDITAIEVLKDADATAIYGSRGANGVILITTREGKTEKTTVNFTTSTGVAHAPKTINYMKTQQYLQMRRQAFANDGIIDYPATAYDINGTWDKKRYTDWHKTLIGGTANTTNVQGSISGGNNQTRFLLSGGYHNETTVFPKDYNYQRLTFHGNLNHTGINDRLNVQYSTNYTSENNDLPGQDLTQKVRFLPPNAPELYTHDGELNFENGTFENPLAEIEGKYLSDRDNLINNLKLSFKLIPEITTVINLGHTLTSLKESRTNPHTKFDPALGLTSNHSSIYTNDANKNSWIIEPQVIWNKKHDKSTLDFLMGATFQKQTDQVLSHFASGFANNSLIYNLTAANTLMVQRDISAQYKYQAYFGRVNYNLNNKYIINLTGRRDGSSRFGPGQKYATFGAVGMAWIFSEEKVIHNFIPFLSFGKLRASYGITGNDQIGNYQFLETYSASGSNYNGFSGLLPTRIHNPNFGWEVNKKFGSAIELGFLNNNINLTLEYYKNLSSNQLMSSPLPATTGFPNMQANLNAVVENKGLELIISTTNLKTNSLKWITDLNFSSPRNKLVSFPNLEDSPYAQVLVVGESLNIKKLYQVIGVDPNTGIYQFKDFNGDGVISAPEDQQFLVDLSPKFSGGLYNSISFKNIELSFLLHFTKRKGYNHILGNAPPGQMTNQPAFTTDQWQQPGDNTNTQLFTAGYNRDAVIAFSQYMFSNASISDASFIRLKNAAFTYTIPLKSNKAEYKMFVQGENLLLFTKFKSGDPEQLIGFLPPLRKVVFGIHLAF